MIARVGIAALPSSRPFADDESWKWTAPPPRLGLGTQKPDRLLRDSQPSRRGEAAVRLTDNMTDTEANVTAALVIGPRSHVNGQPHSPLVFRLLRRGDIHAISATQH